VTQKVKNCDKSQKSGHDKL